MSENEFPRIPTTGSGSGPAYSVEARYMYHEPVKIQGTWLHREWKRIYFEKNSPGVPSHTLNRVADEHQLLSYQAANALRWWLHAEHANSHFCLQTRIVKHMVEYNHKITAVAAFGSIGGDDRSDIMPDFPNKADAAKADAQ